jgi:hypothetical protein
MVPGPGSYQQAMDLSSMIKKEKIRYSHRSSFKSKSPKAIIMK